MNTAEIFLLKAVKSVVKVSFSFPPLRPSVPEEEAFQKQTANAESLEGREFLILFLRSASSVNYMMLAGSVGFLS